MYRTESFGRLKCNTQTKVVLTPVACTGSTSPMVVTPMPCTGSTGPMVVTPIPCTGSNGQWLRRGLRVASRGLQSISVESHGVCFMCVSCIPSGQPQGYELHRKKKWCAQCPTFWRLSYSVTVTLFCYIQRHGTLFCYILQSFAHNRGMELFNV